MKEFRACQHKKTGLDWIQIGGHVPRLYKKMFSIPPVGLEGWYGPVVASMEWAHVFFVSCRKKTSRPWRMTDSQVEGQAGRHKFRYMVWTWMKFKDVDLCVVFSGITAFVIDIHHCRCFRREPARNTWFSQRRWTPTGSQPKDQRA